MKEEKGAGRKGRAYLRDFVVSEDGKYVYQGITYSFDGDAKAKKRSYAYISTLFLSAILFTLVSGCIPAAGMDNCFYMLIPFLIQVATGVFLAVAVIRLLIAKEPLRAYVYQKTALALADRAIANVVTPVVCLIATAVYLILNGFDGKIPGTIAYIIFNVATATLSYLLHRFAKKIKYKKHLPISKVEEE